MHCMAAASPRGGLSKTAWTKNKLEELRRRSPGHNGPASNAKPQANGNMGSETQKRRLITFIGGIDMCDGRYDTPRHSLFHTLATVHTEDFHQACITGADIHKGGEQPAALHPGCCCYLTPQEPESNDCMNESMDECVHESCASNMTILLTLRISVYAHACMRGLCM